MPQRQPKWRRKPGERPRQILRAALEVFGETGVASARLDEIADRAGVSKGTIYLYFANKEELFRQAIRHALAPVQATQDPPAAGSPTRQLLDTISRQWVFLTSPDTITVSRLVQAEQWQFPELAELYATEVVSRFGEELRPIIRRGIDVGDFRDLDPSVAARMLTALAIQSALWRETGVPSSLARKNSEEVLRELTGFYLQAIASSNNASPQADGAL
ncbi:MAG: TetR/AcrR family transcriptional regulator [Gemmatimonadaceae bacterium]